MNTGKPSKLLASLVTLAGGVLLLGGAVTAIRFLGLPFASYGDDILGEQLGQMAGMFLGLVCGGFALAHGIGSLRGKLSLPFKLVPPHLLWIVFALVLGVGNLLLNLKFAENTLFPLLFLLGSALPTLAVLAWAFPRLGWPATWRQASLMLVAGSTLSIAIAILLEIGLPYIYYRLLYPLGYITEEFLGIFNFSGPDFLERLFYSPMLVIFVLFVALNAPIPEELAKMLGPVLMGRRIQNERQAFALGLAAGAGFAILENMLYQGIYATDNGWTWGGVTLLRGIGSTNHALWTAIISLAWFRARNRETGWFRHLAGTYLLSVGLHTLWNGGFDILVYLTGLDYYTGVGPSISLYGEYIEILLIVFLVVLSAGLWWLLRRYVVSLGAEKPVEEAPLLVSPRALAGWALACALIIIPIGAAIGPAWKAIQMAIFGSQ